MIKIHKSALTVEGRKILKMLVEKYGMQEDKATQLLSDGGLALALALCRIAG